MLLNHKSRSSASPFAQLFASRILRRMEQPKNKGGRPRKSDSERLVQRSIRLPPDLWAKIDAHGLEWLRAVIKRARPPAG